MLLQVLKKTNAVELSYQGICSMSPDSATTARAERLAKSDRWRDLSYNDHYVWGACRSSGVRWYSVVFSRRGTGAFKCNCPSRKQPCKHALGLAFLYLQQPGGFSFSAKTPDYVKAWNPHRPAAKPTADEVAEKAAEQARQRLRAREKRLFQMEAGLAELKQWLSDLVRQGLAVLDGAPHEVFQEISERMVNAKLGSLARRVRNLAFVVGQKDWHEKILAEFGDIYLMIRGFENLTRLPPPLQQEMLNVLGIHTKKEALETLDGISDTWLVIGQTEQSDDERLFYRLTWIAGQETGRTALLLDFAWGSNPYEHNRVVGTQFKGEIVYYPSAWPLRAMVRKYVPANSVFTVRGFENFEQFAGAYAEALRHNPWLADFPAFLENVIPVFRHDRFFLLDTEKKQLPLSVKDQWGWKMLALSGGRPIAVFGQWDGSTLKPLSGVANDRFHILSDTKPLPRPARQWRSW
ncbi:MAG: hypothetical protein D6714_13715 [Bacteroidetes bacterium]|nr:MAG: hypothetical protein D6714_13715 [Bacteroidota bacterium]